MGTTSFNQLLFQTAFCCMACDGDIDHREIAVIKSMCKKSPLFENFDYKTEINLLVDKVNTDGKKFMANYFELVENASLTEEEELNLMDIAIQTILADEVIEYAEIKFFKNIRYRLKVSNSKILERFDGITDMEQFLEQDIVTESLLDKITRQYLDAEELPQFEHISFDTTIK